MAILAGKLKLFKRVYINKKRGFVLSYQLDFQIIRKACVSTVF